MAYEKDVNRMLTFRRTREAKKDPAERMTEEEMMAEVRATLEEDRRREAARLSRERSNWAKAREVWLSELSRCENFHQAMEATREYAACGRRYSSDVDQELVRMQNDLFGLDDYGLGIYSIHLNELRLIDALRQRGVLPDRDSFEAAMAVAAERFADLLRRNDLARWADAYESGDYLLIARQ